VQRLFWATVISLETPPSHIKAARGSEQDDNLSVYKRVCVSVSLYASASASDR